MSILMFFVDGIGIGEEDADRNPFARFPSPFFPNFKGKSRKRLPFDGICIPTDPTLGVAGLPQSATGQTTLLSGVNAAKALGRHLPGFPTVSLIKILNQHSIFLQLQEKQCNATFANAFTPEYFEKVKKRVSATTRSVMASEYPFRMVYDDLIEGRALSHDLSNDFLTGLGLQVPKRTPEEAGAILCDILANVDFCLFEYFLTDRIGHACNFAAAEIEIEKLDRFLRTILDNIDLTENTVLLASDHGNFEDLSVAVHTRNLVPTSVWGKNKQMFSKNIFSIQDVPHQILSCL